MSAIPRLRMLLFLGLALAIAIGVYLALEGRTTRPPALVGVLVAARDLQIAEPITPTMLQVRQIPVDAVPGPSAALASDLDQVLRGTPREPIYAGEVIQRVRLFGPHLTVTSAPELALLKKGFGLISVQANRSNMPTTGLRAGDHVALFSTLQRAPAGGSDAGASIATSQLEVALIDPAILVSAVDMAPGGPAESQVTLVVPPREMAAVVLANRLGVYSFALLRPDDAGQARPGLTRPRDLETLRGGPRYAGQ